MARLAAERSIPAKRICICPDPGKEKWVHLFEPPFTAKSHELKSGRERSSQSPHPKPGGNREDKSNDRRNGNEAEKNSPVDANIPRHLLTKIDFANPIETASILRDPAIAYMH